MKFLKFLISLSSRSVTIFFAILFLLAALSYYINPVKAWPLSLLGLSFPALFVLMGLFFLIWVVRKRWFALLPLGVMLMGYPQIKNLAAWRFKEIVVENKGNNVRIMTYNARNFDLYNWSNNARSKALIYEMIKEENPDIICFQEFYSDTTSSFNNIRDLNRLGYHYYAFAEELTLRRYNQWGIATFSKYPIMESRKILRSRYKTGYGFYPYKGVFTRIKMDTVQFGLYNVHMQSVHFAEQDYEAIKDAAEEKDISWMRGRTIIAKIVNACRRRGLQADEMAELLKHDVEKYIIAGDFNDTPSSYTYKKVRGELKDAFLQVGSGLGVTYNGPIPGLRIDYLLHTPGITPLSVEIVNNKISDHKPLIGNFAISE